MYLMLCNTLMIVFCAVVDATSVGGCSNLLVILGYIPFVLYLMNRVMEEKRETLKKSALALVVVVATMVAITFYVFLYF